MSDHTTAFRQAVDEIAKEMPLTFQGIAWVQGVIERHLATLLEQVEAERDALKQSILDLSHPNILMLLADRDALQSQLASAQAEIATLKKDAADNSEALTIAYGMGSASRNDEVRALQSQLDEARKMLEREADTARRMAAGAVESCPQEMRDWFKRKSERITAFLAKGK